MLIQKHNPSATRSQEKSPGKNDQTLADARSTANKPMDAREQAVIGVSSRSFAGQKASGAAVEKTQGDSLHEPAMVTRCHQYW
jgi:hypothetical protein